MKGANLEESNMAGVNLRVCNARFANLQNCTLRYVFLVYHSYLVFSTDFEFVLCFSLALFLSPRGAVLAGADLEVITLTNLSFKFHSYDKIKRNFVWLP